MDLFGSKKISELQDRIKELELESREQVSRIEELELELEKQEENQNKLLLEEIRYKSYIETKSKELECIEDSIKNLTSHFRNLLDDKDDRKKILGYIEDFVSLNAYNTNLKKEICATENELHSLNQELLSIKEQSEKYWSEKKYEVKSVVMHELYQSANQTEFDAIRALANDVDSIDIEKLKHDLNLKYANYHEVIAIRGLMPNTYLLRNYSLYQLLNEFLQMNVSMLVKQMNTHTWESIHSKALIIIKNINDALLASNLEFKGDFEDVIIGYLKAKYLVVSKQRYDRQKEKEEREAQRDYERAIKKALKDEEKAQEQLEKKQREIEKAESATQIAKLNEQISKLKEALLNAKELRERAQSMAQQTKCGYVYVISNIGSFGKDIYKIGMTRRLDPMDRILELSNASVPFPFDVHTFIYSQDAPTLEATLHRVFEDKKVNTVNYRKEYFNVTLDEIKIELDKLGIHTDFVEEPDAFQYRESKRGVSLFQV